MATVKDWVKSVNLMLVDPPKDLHPVKVIEKLNRARDRATAIILNINPEVLGEKTTISVSEGDEYVDLSTNSTVPQNIIKVYDETNENEILMADEIYNMFDTEGTVRYFYILGARMYLMPIPEDDFTLAIYWAKPLVEFSSLTDTVSDKIDVKNYCVAYAAYTLAATERDKLSTQFELQVAEQDLIKKLGTPLMGRNAKVKNIYQGLI